MRIIRVLMVSAVLATMLIPEVTLAARAKASNETKINQDIDNIIIDNGSIKKNGLIVAEAVAENERLALITKLTENAKKVTLPKGKFIINASAYTAAADECGKSDGITASGLKVKESETIACPPQFPFGTKINISGMGTYICQDRGGAIKGNHIDIYVETKAEAFRFGRRNLEAEVIS